jgi:hypothetical protein
MQLLGKVVIMELLGILIFTSVPVWAGSRNNGSQLEMIQNSENTRAIMESLITSRLADAIYFLNGGHSL